MPLILVNTR